MSESMPVCKGATITRSKQFTEADVMLFHLVLGDVSLEQEQPVPTGPVVPQVAPLPLVSAFMAVVAAGHARRPTAARFVSQDVRFREPAYTGELLTTTTHIAGYDRASETIQIHARCSSDDGRILAEADFSLAEH